MKFWKTEAPDFWPWLIVALCVFFVVVTLAGCCPYRWHEDDIRRCMDDLQRVRLDDYACRMGREIAK